jgi:tetratricopeptide (TPR) repeat protein
VVNVTGLSLAAMLLTAVAGTGILIPFLRSGRWPLERLADPLEERRLTLLHSLRELDADRASGTLAEADYWSLRHDTELQAVATLRSLKAHDGRRELAAAVAPGRRRKAANARAARSGLLAGILVAAGIVAATIPLLAGAVANRMSGDLITGQTPPSGPAVADSLSFFEQRVQTNPNDVNARLDLAQQEANAGLLQEASVQYLAVIQLDPRNTEARAQAGLLLFQAGLPDQALKVIDQALQIDPAYPQALYARGLILLKGLHRPADAAAAFRTYLVAAPFGSHRSEVELLLQQAQAG